MCGAFCAWHRNWWLLFCVSQTQHFKTSVLWLTRGTKLAKYVFKCLKGPTIFKTLNFLSVYTQRMTSEFVHSVSNFPIFSSKHQRKWWNLFYNRTLRSGLFFYKQILFFQLATFEWKAYTSYSKSITVHDLKFKMIIYLWYFFVNYGNLQILNLAKVDN